MPEGAPVAAAHVCRLAICSAADVLAAQATHCYQRPLNGVLHHRA
jgi:hypothetical protein